MMQTVGGCTVLMLCRTCSSVSAFGALHKQQMEAQQAMVVRFDPKLDKELVLVPVKVKTGTTGHTSRCMHLV